jgi:hypothetical protein
LLLKVKAERIVPNNMERTKKAFLDFAKQLFKSSLTPTHPSNSAQRLADDFKP